MSLPAIMKFRSQFSLRSVPRRNSIHTGLVGSFQFVSAEFQKTCIGIDSGVKSQKIKYVVEYG